MQEGASLLCAAGKFLTYVCLPTRRKEDALFPSSGSFLVVGQHTVSFHLNMGVVSESRSSKSSKWKGLFSGLGCLMDIMPCNERLICKLFLWAGV